MLELGPLLLFKDLVLVEKGKIILTFPKNLKTLLRLGIKLHFNLLSRRFCFYLHAYFDLFLKVKNMDPRKLRILRKLNLSSM